MNTYTKNMIDSENHSFRNADEHLRFRFITDLTLPHKISPFQFLLRRFRVRGNFSYEVVLAFVLAKQ